MTNSDTSPDTSPQSEVQDSATRQAPLLNDRAAKALLAAVDAIYSAHSDTDSSDRVSSNLVARVRLGLSRFPSGGRAGDLDPSLPVAEIVKRAELMLHYARRVPAVWDELRPRRGPQGHGKRHRLRYPKYQRYLEKIRKRTDKRSLRRSAPSPAAEAAPPRVGQ